MLQELTDHTRQHLATDRFAGGKDHRLDPQHPFTPTQVRRQTLKLAIVETLVCQT